MGLTHPPFLVFGLGTLLQYFTVSPDYPHLECDSSVSHQLDSAFSQHLLPAYPALLCFESLGLMHFVGPIPGTLSFVALSFRD